MEEKEILQLWKQGYTKQKVAEIYKSRYNQYIRIARLDIRNRHAGKFISSMEALAAVEKVLWKYTQRR